MKKKSLKVDPLTQADKNLFNTIIGLGITPGSKQLLNWFIHTDDLTSAKSLVDILKKVLPGVSCFNKCSIEIIQDSDGECTILINTPDFLFNIKNVLKFSRMLYDIATKNGGNYDFWEIEIDGNQQ
jgi:hypothetical protein